MTAPDPSAAAGPPPGLPPQLAPLAAVARTLRGAIVITDAAGGVTWVNDSFVRLSGYTLDELRGQPPGRRLQGPDSDPATIATMRAALAAGRPFDVEILNYARDGRQYWVRIEAQPIRDDGGVVVGHVALQLDVSEFRVAQARDATIEKAGDGLLACETIDAAARVVADALASTTDVRAAQVWLVEPGREHLRYLYGAAADDDGREWIGIGATLTFARGTEWIVGVGAPGVAWGTQRPCAKTDFWVRDHTGSYSRRARAAEQARIRTVCAVPVLGPEGVLAVIEIGGSHNFPGHEQLPALVERVAQQFTSFLLRYQSRRAFEVVFRQSPDALLLVDDGGVVSRSNARAQDLFGAVLGRPLHELLDDAPALLAAALDPADTTPIFTRHGHGVAGQAFSAEVTVASTTATGARATIVSVRDLTERHRAEEETRRALAEKVTLVQEVHHRVKNNLQVLTGLLTLQAERSDEPPVRAAMRDATHRIQSMALVHQLLYDGDDLARIALGDYVQTLCKTLRASLAPDAEVRVAADRIEVVLERAIPCGLLVNELLTNAFKHGRSANGRCVVEATLERTAAGFAMTVRDHGPGKPAAGGRRGSLGQTLIQSLTRQLRAKMQVTVDGGTAVRIDVPDPAA
jgi:PAS domain S-box-containing protein